MQDDKHGNRLFRFSTFYLNQDTHDMAGITSQYYLAHIFTMCSTREGLIYRILKKIKGQFRFTCSFPGGSVVKHQPVSARDKGSIPGSGRSPGRGNTSPSQYSCLENPMDERSLVDQSPWGHKESDTTERLIHRYTQYNFSSMSHISLSAWALIHFQVHPV